MRPDTLKSLLAAREAKRPVALVSNLESGAQSLVYRDAVEGSLDLDEAIVASARTALRDDKSGRADAYGTPLFVQVFNPPKRMIIVGAVHIAQPLMTLAQTSGYEVVIVDPRGAFATRDRFPGVTLSEDWPDEALETLRIDNRSAVVTLTHDPKLDDPALHVALRSEAFYIGSLGSRKTHGRRVERLTEDGYTEEEIARIHAPVGLSINAKSPAEIAISIMAQITQVLRAE
ncbi:MAG: XdhC family protein [Alphaproteobacteria bacterium]|nr:XdhC family protein [Alphaproteobacteria bacterium]